MITISTCDLCSLLLDLEAIETEIDNLNDLLYREKKRPKHEKNLIAYCKMAMHHKAMQRENARNRLFQIINVNPELQEEVKAWEEKPNEG